jgi:hypothetical protein
LPFKSSATIAMIIRKPIAAVIIIFLSGYLLSSLQIHILQTAV